MNKFLVFLAFLIAQSFCLAKEALSLKGVRFSINPPSAFYLSKEKKISLSYPDTECLEVRKRVGKKNIGFFCSTHSKAFMRDFGVFEKQDDANSGGQAVDEGAASYTLATGMSTYEVAPFTDKGIKSYAAEVDCDEAGGAVYRATSTCHVAIAMLKNGRFLYSNIVIKNHVSGAEGGKVADIKKFWESLEPTDAN
ncbi:hypothetical protein GCM10007860_25120 [Chitiniphilus shinanonensis]|uniref:Uncharacterized protein n=1 Tax=Chitiniphilus shinanonensis TaxID=553088 RepID=A0ABQ6BW04_9NEIS|nr:hypothetical protein [Chitiniphilus shinanonensis]GLS05360.1 hypothetical protein GCM10007860_25120 [Chitiniphilus shinanonensis]